MRPNSMHGLSAAGCLEVDAITGANGVSNVQFGTY